METITVLWIVGILGVLLLISGYTKYKDKKTERGMDRMAIGGLAAVVAFGLIFGFFAPLTAVPSPVPVTPTIPEVADICAVTGPLPYAALNFSGDTWSQSGANPSSGPADDVKVYAAGTDVTIPGVTPLDTISVTAGVGGTTTKILRSCINYEIYWDGGAVSYDMKHASRQFTPVKTDTGEIPFQTVEFHNIKVVATPDDLLEEDSTDGRINGQSNVSGEAGSSNIVMIGEDSTPADGDKVFYNKTNGLGTDTFYLKILPGATGGDKVLKNPVLCFHNLANPMEGDEFSLVQFTHLSANNFGAPVVITDIVKAGKCVSLGDEIIGGGFGEYRLQFNVVDANFVATTDVMNICLDDLGEYAGEDLLSGEKAAPTCITVQAKV